MTIALIFNDKTIKAKGKVKNLGECLLNNELSVEEVIHFS
jgi:hypothetical protein